MKKGLASTRNMSRIMETAQELAADDRAKERMGLIFGKPGLGKTEGALMVLNQIEHTVFLRAKSAWTVNWFLRELVVELGESPHNKTEDLFRQAVNSLAEWPRLIIVDEVDHMARRGELIETLRDIHDSALNPWLLIGMQGAELKLKRYAHVYDRFRYVVQVEILKVDDVEEIARELCEIPLGDGAANRVHQMSGGIIRRIVRYLAYGERKAKLNKASQIDATIFQPGVKA